MYKGIENFESKMQGHIKKYYARMYVNNDGDFIGIDKATGNKVLIVDNNYYKRRENQVNDYLKSGIINFEVNNLHIDYAYRLTCKVQCPYCKIDFDSIGHEGTDGFNFEHNSDTGVKDSCPANGDDDAIYCTYHKGKFYLNTYYDDTPNLDITLQLSGLFIKLFKAYASSQGK